MDQSAKFFDFACRLLARRDYFTEEMRQKITAKGATAEEAARAIEKLNKFKYLDDEKVLRKYVSEKPVVISLNGSIQIKNNTNAYHIQYFSCT